MHTGHRIKQIIADKQAESKLVEYLSLLVEQYGQKAKQQESTPLKVFLEECKTVNHSSETTVTTQEPMVVASLERVAVSSDTEVAKAQMRANPPQNMTDTPTETGEQAKPERVQALQKLRTQAQAERPSEKPRAEKKFAYRIVHSTTTSPQTHTITQTNTHYETQRTEAPTTPTLGGAPEQDHLIVQKEMLRLLLKQDRDVHNRTEALAIIHDDPTLKHLESVFKERVHRHHTHKHHAAMLKAQIEDLHHRRTARTTPNKGNGQECSHVQALKDQLAHHEAEAEANHPCH